LALVGNAYRGVGIPQCVVMAHVAAERIAALFRAD
jgi:protoporphyrinogen oxidase